MTKALRDTYNYIKKLNKLGSPPSIDNIGTKFDITPQGAWRRVQRLEELGYLEHKSQRKYKILK
jgi:Mn-dependent DtxR family transcriptional regulator